MNKLFIEKYNIPVPRYTSYPPANFFNAEYSAEKYLEDVVNSNRVGTDKISFYIHIPFCSNLCLYCACNKQLLPNQHSHIRKYVDYIEKEFDLLSERIDNSNRKVHQIHFGGGSPTSIPLHYINRILKMIRDRFVFSSEAELAIECHPAHLDESDWLSLINMGFNRMSIGIQDLQEEVLKGVKRKPSKLPLNEVISLLHEKNVSINVDLIYGLPNQTAESFEKTVEQVLLLRPNRLVTFSYAHVPWVHPIQKSLEKIGLPIPEEKEKMFLRATKMAKKHGYKQIGLDHFVLPKDSLYKALQTGNLNRNFQGYCTPETTGQVYALGITGISQLNSSYSQNTKVLSNYYQELDAGRLPIAIGYRLSCEERMARDIITELMCNYATDPIEHTQRYGMSFESLNDISFLDYDMLVEMKEDGLCDILGTTITIKQDAHPFVRNVASCFDIHYNPSNPRGYSKPV